MNKKGFTLVEMLIVITLISIIALMAIPLMTNYIKKGENDKYKAFENDIFMATEAYLQKYIDNYPQLSNVGGVAYIYMDELVKEKLVKSNLVNPKTSEKIGECTENSCTIDDYTITVIKQEDGTYSYELVNGIADECIYTPNEVVFDEGYTGKAKTFTPKCSGRYKIEAWGAQGGNEGGKGAYTSGIITLPSQTNMYVYVGGTGSVSPAGIAQNTSGGYNGGGSTQGQDCCDRSFGSGGGATDIRLTSGAWNNQKSLASRIMVAAGGGGRFSDGTAVSNGGAGGALTGLNASGDYTDWCIGFGGTQTSGGMIGITSGKYCEEGSNTTYTQPGLITGGFGYGGAHGSQGNNSTGGGSGYYGGSSSGHIASAGGGSSYISGHTGAIAIKSESNISPRNDSKDNLCKIGTNDITCSYHYSNFIFTDTKMIDGNSSMPNKSGSGNSTGNSGNGYAKITYLGK